MLEGRHNVPGQLNVLVLDVDSEVTNHGRHNRLVVFRGVDDEADIITVREDLRGLPMSTEADRRKMALHPHHRLHAKGQRLVYVESSGVYNEAFGPGGSIDHTYRLMR